MSRATQVEALWNGLRDANGAILNAGKVYTYYGGTTDALALFTAQNKSSSAANPIILNAEGKASVWGDGTYKFVVKDSSNNTLLTIDNVVYGLPDDDNVWAGNSSGSANAYAITPTPAIAAYAHGQTFTFIPNFTSTGAATLNVNALGAVTINKADGSAIGAGDITSGTIISCTYDTSSTAKFILSTVTTYASLTVTGTVTTPNVKSATAQTVGTTGAASLILISNNVTRLTLDSAGNWAFGADNTHNFGSAAAAAATVHAYALKSNGVLSIGTINASDFSFLTSNATKWVLKAAGELIPNADNTYSLGNASFACSTVFSYGVKSPTTLFLHTTGLNNLNLGTAATTNWYIDGSSKAIIPNGAYELGHSAANIEKIHAKTVYSNGLNVNLNFGTNATTDWYIDYGNKGLVPNGNYNVGHAASPCNTVYADEFLLTTRQTYTSFAYTVRRSLNPAAATAAQCADSINTLWQDLETAGLLIYT